MPREDRTPHVAGAWERPRSPHLPRPKRQLTLHALQDALREADPATQGFGLAELFQKRPLKNKKPLPGYGRGLKAKFD